MNIQSILVLAGLVVFFVLAIAWISKNGGWQGGGCGGCSGRRVQCRFEKVSKDTECGFPGRGGFGLRTRAAVWGARRIA